MHWKANCGGRVWLRISQSAYARLPSIVPCFWVITRNNLEINKIKCFGKNALAALEISEFNPVHEKAVLAHSGMIFRPSTSLVNEEEVLWWISPLVCVGIIQQNY